MVATAHPCKFGAAIEAAVGPGVLEIPPRVASLEFADAKCATMTPTLENLAEFLEERLVKTQAGGGVVRIRVPASTSNLGPGFDCIGNSPRLWVAAVD